MSYIKFRDSDAKQIGIVTIIDSHTIQISGVAKNLSGFKLYTDDDMMFGDYSGFIYDYEEPNLEEQTYKYTDDNHKYQAPEEPLYITRFVDDGHGQLDGYTEQEAKTFGSLIIPKTVPFLNYKFLEWQPPIPQAGKITSDNTFTAVFEYIPTTDEVKQAKLKELGEKCSLEIEQGQTITLSDGTQEHFNYSERNCSNIDNAFTIVSMAFHQLGKKVSVPFYNSNNICKMYSFDDIIKIYLSKTALITHRLTLCHQLQQMVSEVSFYDDEKIKKVTLSEESLQGNYKTKFSSIMENTNKIMSDLITVANNAKERTEGDDTI